MSTQTISERLKELRQSLNLTQREMAKDLNITAAALSKYESQIANPSINVLISIAKKYNVSVDWLLGLSDNYSTNKLKTYADILQNIFQLATSLNNLEFDFDGISIDGYEDEDGEFLTDTYITISDDTLAFLLNKLNKTYILYKDKTIDIDVLQAVVDSLKKDCKNKEIGF